MKRILLPLILATIFACDKKEAKTAVDYALISGKIENKNGVVTVNSMDRTFSEPLNFNADGTFADTLNADRNSYVIFDGKNPVFIHVEPGFDLNISYDVNDYSNSIKVTGKGAEINRYVIAKRKNERDIFGDPKQTFTLSEEDFKNKFRGIRDSQDSLLTSMDGIPKDFIEKEKRSLQYSYLGYLFNYENAYKYFTKDESFTVSEDFLSEMDDVDYGNEEDFTFSQDYKNLVSNHYSKKAKEKSEDESIAYDIAYLKTLSGIENETIKNGLLFSFAESSMGYSKDVEEFYQLYMDNSTNAENNEAIEKVYKKLTGLAVGKPSPKFTDYKNFDGSTTSLEDFKGKYVYIDVWATWCGPCVREIPSLKKVEKQFHDKNIEFVSISIDKEKDFEKWKTMVQDRELGGTQLFADSDWKSQFVQEYEIKGIPRFILIDPQGNILDANAPRPSDPKLVEVFNGLSI
ncbi:TlpA family protein disulfide reductase [Hyunsoonleella rubra]|uniref:TlpA family protein disulfide reductase n=1 Tax=Hyunsoonleella rubra TaxID=1737062 RepID=A0ABW5TAJ5_9FLAO